MNRYEAIETIINCLTDEFVIACNGFISRELFNIKDRPQNFYMLGSMGLASSIGLGISSVKTDKKVIILSGDGNMLMSFGTFVTIGKISPRNLVQIVLDNECHESTGGQETSSSIVDFTKIAKSTNFKQSKFVDNLSTLQKVFTFLLKEEGPSFLHVKINKGTKDLQRISIEPPEILNRFMETLHLNQ
tara:strand:+ start:150 stop:713 length:564 start_codon:yes stop_codon:yes gene_type:complete